MDKEKFELIWDNIKNGKWAKTKMLGRGSFGNVYQAFETSTGIPITIK